MGGASWLNILLKEGLVWSRSLVVSLKRLDMLELSDSPVLVLILLLRLLVDTFLEGGCFLNLLANSENTKKKNNIVLFEDEIWHYTK